MSSIDKSLIGDASNILSGHIEIPSEAFWQLCGVALRWVGRSFSDHTQFSPELILELGTLEFPKSHSAFGDAVMTGKSIPALFIRIGEALVPVAPRNAIINIVDFWGHRAQATPFRRHRSLTQRVSNFLASRVDFRSISKGPCWVRDEHRGVQAPFAAVLYQRAYSVTASCERSSGNGQRYAQVKNGQWSGPLVLRGAHGFYFVIILGREDLKRLPAIETELLDLVANNSSWGIQIEGTSYGFRFSCADGSGLKPEEIVVLAVLPQEYTSPDIVELPATRSAHVLPTVDLVSIFDSIETMSEFDRFWAYIKLDFGPSSGVKRRRT